MLIVIINLIFSNGYGKLALSLRQKRKTEEPSYPINPYVNDQTREVELYSVTVNKLLSLAATPPAGSKRTGESGAVR